jgi:putative ABC transport system permease protein
VRWGVGGVQVGRLLQIVGIDLQHDPQVRVYTLLEGRMPAEGKYETAISREYASDKGLELGEELVFATGAGVEHLEVVGILADEGAATINEGEVAFVSLDVAQQLFGLDNQLSEIAVRSAESLRNDPQALALLKADLQDRLGEDARADYPAGRGDLVPKMLNTYQLGLSFFSIIAVFVGAFLIYNTFSMTIVERTQEIGMLRAIGMRRAQILSMVLSEAVLLSFFGSLLGVLGGVLLSRGLMRLLDALVAVDRAELPVSAEALLISVGIGVLVTLAAAFLPALQATNISPLQALRARSEVRSRIHPLVWLAGLVLVLAAWFGLYRAEWRENIMIAAGMISFILLLLGVVLTIPLVIAPLERVARGFARLMYGQEGALGCANVRRSGQRTLLTVACLVVSFIMIIGIGTVAHAYKEDVRTWVDNSLGGDVYLQSGEVMPESLGDDLLKLSGIKVASPMRLLRVDISEQTLRNAPDPFDQVLFTALDPAKFRQISDMVFSGGQGGSEQYWNDLMQGNTVFISTVVAEQLDLQVGDEIVLRTRRGEHAFRIAAVITDFNNQGRVVVGTYTDLRRWFSESGADRFFIQLTPGTDSEQIAQIIRENFQDRYNLNIQTSKVVKASVFGMVDQAFVLFDVLGLIGVAIGGMGVVNTMTMNVMERTRELGSLRSLGMTRGQMLRMILSEAFGLGVIGGGYGLLVGFSISHVMMYILSLLTSYDIEYIFTIQPYLLSIFLAVVISQLAAIGPAMRAARVNIIEAIKHE